MPDAVPQLPSGPRPPRPQNRPKPGGEPVELKSLNTGEGTYYVRVSENRDNATGT